MTDLHEQRRDLTDQYRDLEIRLTGVWRADEQAHLQRQIAALSDDIWQLTAKIDAGETS